MPQIFSGIVTRTGKMVKTVTVVVTRRVEHHKIPILVKRTSKFLVHDEHEQAVEGDKVSIIHGARFSRRKAFRLETIDRRGKNPANFPAGADAQGKAPDVENDGSGRRRGSAGEVNVEKVKRKGIGSAVGGEKGEARGAVMEAIASVRDIPAHLEAR